MKHLTFLSNQNQQTFTDNSHTRFDISIDRHVTRDSRSWIFLTQLHVPLSLLNFSARSLLFDRKSVHAHLFVISCSLVQQTSILNSDFCNLYKVVCLSPRDHIVNFKGADYLPLTATDSTDVIRFEIRPLNPREKLPSYTGVTSPTIMSFFQRSLTSIPTLDMATWHDERFKIVLDSTDRRSSRVRANTGCDFDIQLPQPIELGADQRWELELNALFLNKLVLDNVQFPLTVPNSVFEDMAFIIVKKGKKREDGKVGLDYQRITRSRDILNNPNTDKQTFETPQAVINQLNAYLRQFNLQRDGAKFRYLPSTGKVAWMYETIHPSTTFRRPDGYDPRVENLEEVLVGIPKKGLGQLLGLVDPVRDDLEEDEYVYFSLWRPTLRGLKSEYSDGLVQKKFVFGFPAFPPDEEAPKSMPVMVTCNLVRTSCLGANFIRLLRLINTGENYKHPYVIASNFEHPIPVALDVKSFASIQIQLCDLSGQVLPHAAHHVTNPSVKTVVELTLRKCDIN